MGATFQARPVRRGALVACAAVSVLLLAGSAPIAMARQAPLRSSAVTASPQVRISDVGGNNAEVWQAAHGRYVYDVWLFCKRTSSVCLARSTDHGRTFGRPVTLPRSAFNPRTGAYSWDPAVAVGPKGTVYVVYMREAHRRTYPLVAVSTNHGRSFSRVTSLGSPVRDNWADRPFIAVARGGRVYVTWDYGPKASLVRTTCARNGSCSFTHGDFNAVMRTSADRGHTWTPIVHISPRYPHGGDLQANITTGPRGRVDVLLLHMPTNPRTYRLHRGNVWFTSSTDHGRTWSKPIRVGWRHRTISLKEWWIDGNLARDRAGHLYVTWDTQGSRGDVGWLSISRSAGRRWSRPVRVTPDHDSAMHLLQSAGTGKHTAYIGWLTDASPKGYAQWVRRYTLGKGWTSRPVRVSTRYGETRVWPGDTFGISVVRRSHPRKAVLSWGSAVRGVGPRGCATNLGAPAPCDEIWRSIVTFHKRR